MRAMANISKDSAPAQPKKRKRQKPKLPQTNSHLYPSESPIAPVEQSADVEAPSADTIVIDFRASPTAPDTRVAVMAEAAVKRSRKPKVPKTIITDAKPRSQVAVKRKARTNSDVEEEDAGDFTFTQSSSTLAVKAQKKAKKKVEDDLPDKVKAPESKVIEQQPLLEGTLQPSQPPQTTISLSCACQQQSNGEVTDAIVFNSDDEPRNAHVIVSNSCLSLPIS